MEPYQAQGFLYMQHPSYTDRQVPISQCYGDWPLLEQPERAKVRGAMIFDVDDHLHPFN